MRKNHSHKEIAGRGAEYFRGQKAGEGGGVPQLQQDRNVGETGRRPVRPEQSEREREKQQMEGERRAEAGSHEA